MTGARLVVVGPHSRRIVRLHSDGTTIGRATSCDVVLDDNAVSRQHARISQDPFGRWIVEDTGSRNGICIDGQRIKSQAVQPNQEVRIHDFTLRVEEPSDQHVSPEATIRATIAMLDEDSDDDVLAVTAGAPSPLSATWLEHLNELHKRLLDLASPSELYTEACLCLAEILDTLVVIVRLPLKPKPLPANPEMLACHYGAPNATPGSFSRFHSHLSKRVLETVRSQNTPIMASSSPASEQNPGLTMVDHSAPHHVFAARVNELDETVDALYVDVLDDESSEETFSFVEAAARQVHFAQTSLFLAELTRQKRELAEANRQLQEKDRIKDEYVLRVTHDIKGHLGAIQSCLSLVANGTLGELAEKQADMVGRAHNRTLQLTGFVRELLELTRMRLSGQTQVAPFSLQAALSTALNNVAEKARDKAIQVSSDIDSTLGKLMGDEVSFTEMLSNLLFNAVTYTPNDKTVHFEAKNDTDAVRIAVSDTGIGIPAAEVAHVFDEFFRATNARKSTKNGTGLGLAIVKQIVERHGGMIDVTSVENEGTTFTVTIPKSVDETVSIRAS